MLIESYVVRIYRRPAGGSQDIVGLVTAEGTETSRSFCNVEELWRILAERPSRPAGGPPVPPPAGSDR